MRSDGRDERDQPDAGPRGSRHVPEPAVPPSSWRNAAWIVVAAASVALIVLVFTTVRLAGPDREFGRIESFPGLPTGGLLTPQQPSTGMPAAASSATAAAGFEGTAAPSNVVPGQPSSQAVPEAPGGEHRPGVPEPTIPGAPAPIPGTPTSSTAPTSPAVAEDDVDVVALTYRFFGHLPDDPAAAWQLMSPQVQGYEEFAQLWQPYSAVVVQYVTVGADGRTVVATVQVSEYKGATTSQRWKLVYEAGENALISQATLLEGGLQDPGGNKPFQ